LKKLLLQTTMLVQQAVAARSVADGRPQLDGKSFGGQSQKN
jgi:hypothetical protein